MALLGVKTAREQAYAPACVIATEAAIALKVALQADRTGAPAVGPEAAEKAIRAKEDQLGGRSLTDGQKAMIRSVVTSGRPVELIVGVAGSGKTTALDAARQAFEDAGYRVVGTSISGQAARTLGAEAGIDESRTIASLLWRLDHGQARLDSRTVVVCDEAGMTDDPAMLRLLAATEAAGSKLIIVGDHRQLGAVGPGGSLQALVDRHTGSVHALRENVRQADPEERAMLAQLRAGSVEQAVNWYADHGRITTAADREQALEQTVAAWANDIAEGRAVDHDGVAAGQRGRPQRPGPTSHAPGRAADRTGAAGGRQRLPGRGSHRHPRPLRRRPAGHLAARPGRRRRPRCRQPDRADGRRPDPHPRDPTRSAPTNSPSVTPQPFIEARAPPSTPPISSPTAAAESSDTSP